MEHALQKWRLAYNVEDGAFESLKAFISAYGSSQEHFSVDSFAPNLLSPNFLSNVNDGVSGHKALQMLRQHRSSGNPTRNPCCSRYQKLVHLQVTFLLLTALELLLHQIRSARNLSQIPIGAR